MAQDLRHMTQSRSGGMRYARLFALGSGGMASVYLSLAVGPSGFNRLVVVKQMHQELLEREETYAMFLAEARLSARLNHPNVVQVSEVVEGQDGIMLVMEYLDGLPLSSLYRGASEQFTLGMRLRVMCEVLAGLHYAHELSDYQGNALGIVHRDVSPQNVIVTYDGRIKLLDFGIAKATASSDQTQSGLIKGRIAYMPPEQLTGSQVDRRSDVYAVGCLLWEAIAGSRIWQDQSDRQIARHVLTGQVPPLSSRVRVDPELEQITARATAREAKDRYPSAEAMRLDLERYLATHSGPVNARSIGDMMGQVFGESRERRQRAIAQAISELDLAAESQVTAPPLESQSFQRITVRGRKPSGTIPRLVFEGTSRSGEHLLAEQSSPGSLARVPASSDPISGRSSVSGAASSRSLPLTSMTTMSAQDSVVKIDPEISPKTTPSFAPRKSRKGMVLAVLGALALAGGVFASGRLSSQPTQTQAAPPPLAAVVVPTKSTRLLSVDVTPRDARVFIDGQAIAGNPATLQVPAGSEHVVRVEREGHETAERRVNSTDNVTLAIELAATGAQAPTVVAEAETEQPEPSGKAEKAARTTARRFVVTKPAPAPAAPKAPSKASTNCDPPFFFQHGIKTYKPGCI